MVGPTGPEARKRTPFQQTRPGPVVQDCKGEEGEPADLAHPQGIVQPRKRYGFEIELGVRDSDRARQ